MERLTKEQLKECLPHATAANIDKFIEPINTTFEKYEIDTPLRRAAFLAQIAHESGNLKYVRELASGEAYEGRKDLGNTEPGDGVRFKGRGLIQITGRANYERLSKDLGFDFIKEPEKLELPGAATLSAGWFWNLRHLNKLADLGTDEAFRKITRRINGGLTHIEDRKKHYIRCIEVLAGPMV